MTPENVIVDFMLCDGVVNFLSMMLSAKFYFCGLFHMEFAIPYIRSLDGKNPQSPDLPTTLRFDFA